MNKKIIGEIVGWYGAIVIILAYALLSFSIIASTDLVYQALNITGALGLMYISFKKKAYQPGVLNIIWVIIATVAMVKIVV